jgi:hypothetical protein
MATTIRACRGGVERSKLTGISDRLFTRISLSVARAVPTKAVRRDSVSRIDGKFEASDTRPADVEEILAALSRDAEPDARQRKAAVSRYLSASAGWREASEVLCGAFAGKEAGLTGDKEE